MDKNLRLLTWLSIIFVACLLLFWLKAILAPFVSAALMAYLGDPLADRLERLGLSRTLAVSGVFFLMTLLFIVCLLVLVPMIAAQIDLLRQVFPGYLLWFKQTVLPWLYSMFGIEQNDEILSRLQLALNQNWEKASDLLVVLIAKVTKSGLAIVGLVGSFALVPVVTFYLLRDWDLLIAHIRDLLPRKNIDTISQLAKECDDVLGAFLRGQLLIMACLGTVYTLGLALLGLDLALLVGSVAGAASIVPYLGAFIGISTAAVAAIVQFHDWIYLIPVVLIFVGGQLLESLFLTPVLVGDKIGLHPVAVIFAVLAGGQLFGFVGVLLALPVAAVLMVLLRHAHHNYTKSIFYHQ